MATAKSCAEEPGQKIENDQMKELNLESQKI